MATNGSICMIEHTKRIANISTNTFPSWIIPIRPLSEEISTGKAKTRTKHAPWQELVKQPRYGSCCKLACQRKIVWNNFLFFHGEFHQQFVEYQAICTYPQVQGPCACLGGEAFSRSWAYKQVPCPTDRELQAQLENVQPSSGAHLSYDSLPKWSTQQVNCAMFQDEIDLVNSE